MFKLSLYLPPSHSLSQIHSRPRLPPGFPHMAISRGSVSEVFL